MKLSKNFTTQEFACPCCGKNKVAGELVTKLQQLRDIINKPIYITSGYRCPIENKKAWGHKNSAHLTGEGVDIKCKGTPLIFLAHMAASNITNIRLGLYPSHLHLDIKPATPSKYWLVKAYGKKPIYSGKEKNLAKFLKDNM